MPRYSLDGIGVRTPANGRYWIAPNAVVVGNVVLEEDASVWFGTMIRGDNEEIRIGRASNIQEGCVLHTDPGYPMTIGENVTVGHMVMLHGCTIGEGSLIGIGSVILNGTTIGRNCLIGAKTLIGEGKTIPDNSVVMGIPGKVVKQVTPEMVARTADGVRKYVANWQRYKAGLLPLG